MKRERLADLCMALGIIFLVMGLALFHAAIFLFGLFCVFVSFRL